VRFIRIRGHSTDNLKQRWSTSTVIAAHEEAHTAISKLGREVLLRTPKSTNPFFGGIVALCVVATLGSCTGTPRAIPPTHGHYAVAPATPTAAPTCWIYKSIFRPTTESFAKQHLDTPDRAEIMKWVARIPASKRSEIRWMRILTPAVGPHVLIFLERPLEQPERGGYSPWVALNTNVFINPKTCEVGAIPTV
jgi:hypothetical protein